MGPVERAVLAELGPTFRARSVAARGGALRVLEGGAGPPLVLLHGRGSAAAIWFPLLPRLAETHRVLAVDLPGFGASTGHRFSGAASGARFPSALAFFADPIAAWLAGEGITGPVLVGHSLGGVVALELALRGVAPTALVLIASMGVGPEISRPGRLYFRAGPERLARAGLVPGSTGPAGTRLTALFREVLTAPGGRPDAADAFDAMVPLTGPLPHLRARLPEIGAPALVLWGDRDDVLPAPLAIAAAAALPRGVLRVERGGHSPHLEDPARGLGILREFLSKNT